ncbi:MAG: ATP synthase F0 sector subunit c, partial [uncultured Sphingosinicella sp.]
GRRSSTVVGRWPGRHRSWHGRFGRGQRVRLVPRERASQPGRRRQPAGPSLHRLRRRRASRPAGVRRCHDPALRRRRL